MNGSPLTWPGTDDGRNQSQGPVVRRTLPAAVWADGRTKGLITRTTAAEARPPGCAVSMRKQRGPSRCWGYLLRVVHDSALRERWPLSRCTPRARARDRERKTDKKVARERDVALAQLVASFVSVPAYYINTK